MESGMVSSNNLLVKNFFQKELPSFSVVAESSYSMFWEIILSDNVIDVKVSGDAGGFSISIFIEKSEYPLWQYDRKVNDLAKTKDENIHSQLIILLKFIKELNNESSI
jgi:hypothetical protein